MRHNDRCVNCGLCEKVCPIAHPSYINDTPLVFAAYDKRERGRSSSGGVFYTIASYVISRGGVVFGAAYDEDLKVRHICARSLDELQALRGSKYVQSDMGDCFRKVKDYLRQGKLVYFTGVGCQVAGLYSYLKNNYDNLFTSDIVCHGVPSQTFFNLHLQYLGRKYQSKVKEYDFRDPRNWVIRERALFENGSIKFEYDGNMSPFLYAFGLGLNYRYSCFSCKFAKIPRQGDISLADYWGVGRSFPLMDTQKGVSLVLVNNEKGRKLWNEIKQYLVHYQSTLEDGARNNPNVVRSSIEPSIRKEFFKILAAEGYDRLAKTHLVCPEKMRNYNIERVMMLRKYHIYQPYMELKRLAKVVLAKFKIK